MDEAGCPPNDKEPWDPAALASRVSFGSESIQNGKGHPVPVAKMDSLYEELMCPHTYSRLFGRPLSLNAFICFY